MAFFYETAYTTGNTDVFDQFLTGFYNEEFTKDDHRRDVINDERKFSTYVRGIAEKFGYTLDLDKGYFLGFGTTGIVYLVTRPGQPPAALKFIWGVGGIESFSSEILGLSLIKEAGLESYVPEYHEAYCKLTGVTVPYVSISGEKMEVKLNGYGVIIEEYAGQSLAVFAMTANKETREWIKSSLKIMCDNMYSRGLVHADLQVGNVTVKVTADGRLKIFFIDLAEIKKADEKNIVEFYDRLAYIFSTSGL